MPKKKFIDRKKAITFQLVHRSQKDPLIADENAPKRVLQPILEKSRNNELEKYGIYFDDDYDYMQHLKPLGCGSTLVPVEPRIKPQKETTKIALPSSVFESNVEEEVGLLNKAAPKGLDLSLDPDVIAALDSDYDYDDSDNEMDDDFILQLNASGSEPEDDDEENMCEMEEMDELGSLNGFDTKSRFTDYSMSSSVIRRNEQLTFLDDRFEQMYSSYDDTGIGALDCEDIEGFIDTKNDNLIKIAEQFEKETQPDKLVTGEGVECHVSESDGETDTDDDNILMEVKEKEKWDCESILTTYSNIYNHPKLIEPPPSNKIRINSKTGMPEINRKAKLTAKALSAFNQDCEDDKRKKGPKSLASAISLLSLRPKNETPEERLKRKKALKAFRKERREEKKLNTNAFKDEKRRMEKMMAHNKSNLMVKI